MMPPPPSNKCRPRSVPQLDPQAPPGAPCRSILYPPFSILIPHSGFGTSEQLRSRPTGLSFFAEETRAGSPCYGLFRGSFCILHSALTSDSLRPRRGHPLVLFFQLIDRPLNAVGLV